MTKIWTIETDYPEDRMALYDEAKNGMDRFELQSAKHLTVEKPLLFSLLKNNISHIEKYSVIWTDILIPLVRGAVRSVIEELTDDDDVQFIPVTIQLSGDSIDKSYFLLNPLNKIDAVDHEKSEPIVVKISGFPDAKVGFKKMVLRTDFPGNGIGRQNDSLTYVIVGDNIADAVLRKTPKGVRFISGIPAVI